MCKAVSHRDAEPQALHHSISTPSRCRHWELLPTGQPRAHVLVIVTKLPGENRLGWLRISVLLLLRLPVCGLSTTTSCTGQGGSRHAQAG